MSKFKLLTDVLQDKKFKSILTDEIEEETHRRNNRLVVYSSKNLDIRRNVFIRLDEQGLMTVDWLTAQFELIQAKQSELSVHERHFVYVIVDSAIIKTVEYYENTVFRRAKNFFKSLFMAGH